MNAPPSSMRVATVQFQSVPDDIPANLAIVDAFTEEAATAGAVLVAFPEMCLLGYWHLRNHDEATLHGLAQPASGPAVGAAVDLARRLGVGVGVGFLEEDGDRLFNSYAVCLPDGTVHVHRKLHSFEHPSISSGDRFTVFDTPWGVKCGILICWDNNLVENVRVTALAGANILVAPHQTGGTRSVSPHGMKPVPRTLWDRRHVDRAAVENEFRGPNGREWLLRWLPSRAHDNGIFIIFSNGVGVDDDEIRTGNAMVLDPYGRIIAETCAPEDTLVLADLDLDLLSMSTGRRWLGGRRPELYGVLTQPTGTERDAATTRFSTIPVSLTPVQHRRDTGSREGGASSGR